MSGTSGIGPQGMPNLPPDSSPRHLQEKTNRDQDANSFSKELVHSRSSNENAKSAPSPSELLKTVSSPAPTSEETFPSELQDKINRITHSIKSAPAPEGNRAEVALDSQLLPDSKVIVRHENGQISMTFETTSETSRQWLDQNREALASHMKDELGIQNGLALNIHMPGNQPPSPDSAKPFIQELASHMAEKIAPLMNSGNAWSDTGVMNMENNPLSGLKVEMSGSGNHMEMIFKADSKEVADLLEEVKGNLAEHLASEMNGNVSVNLKIEQSDNG